MQAYNAYSAGNYSKAIEYAEPVANAPIKEYRLQRFKLSLAVVI